jgi:molybdopterin/thiamine biosynthesis adenylyltransferase
LAAVNAGACSDPMNDSQLLRYSRHILLDDIGIEGQSRLLGSHALIIGAGGLGSPAALYLGSAGVGHITVVDHDARRTFQSAVNC